MQSLEQINKRATAITFVQIMYKSSKTAIVIPRSLDIIFDYGMLIFSFRLKVFRVFVREKLEFYKQILKRSTPRNYHIWQSFFAKNTKNRVFIKRLLILFNTLLFK